mgnify:CR=1 FL=1
MDNTTREIKLKNTDLVAIVDADYYDWLIGIEWRANKDGYAFYNTTINSKPCNYLMHRLVNDTPEGLYTDHINGNRLDNRRINLRTVTPAQNSQWQNRGKKNTSGYKGVSWRKDENVWQVHITLNKKLVHIGLFKNIHEAAEAYNAAAKKHFKEFAKLNVIEHKE